MKANYFAMLFCLILNFHSIFTNCSFGQSIPHLTAKELLLKNKIKLGFSEDKISSLIVANDYDVQLYGYRIIYAQETYQGITVFGKQLVLTFRNDVYCFNNPIELNRVLRFSSFKNSKMIPSNQALISVFEDLRINNAIIYAPVMIGLQKWNYGTLGISNEDIICEKIWYPIAEDNYVLSWQIEIEPLFNGERQLIWVDAKSSKIIGRYYFKIDEIGDSRFRIQEISIHDKHKNENTLALNNLKTPTILNAVFNVISYPAEHFTQNEIPIVNPWYSFSSDLINSDWHYSGNLFHDSTRGNNVWVQEDRDNNNLTKGRCALSQTSGPSLSFLNNFDSLSSPLLYSNQQFALTNLFYWCNLLHDFFLIYGFDESSGNFQFYNYSNKGLGNDGLIADAQDAGAYNNANFSTPPDGISPRMQLYLFNKTNPPRDADLDNGIIIHEYAHGLTNRLTGGPSNSSCLSNAEQAGEGWSDYFALMLTTNWNTATIDDGVLPRSLGTYVLGEPQTGKGIRNYFYSTDQSINPLHYGMLSSMNSEVHKIGELWCATLWDLTWLLIKEKGISRNVINVQSEGGNTIAMKLVIEGIRLQTCRPGFINSRDAILKADTILYHGQFSCLIWKAFAGRGMGVYAQQGSSNSTNDQVADFSDGYGIKMTTITNLINQHEGMEVKLTHLVQSGPCNGIMNFKIVDTLPLNATFVTGGVYDSLTRLISFEVNQSVGESKTYAFTFRVNDGVFYPKTKWFSDSISENSMDSNWQINVQDTYQWQLSNLLKASDPFSLSAESPTVVSEMNLISKKPINLPLSSAAQLIFSNNYQLEAGWDGGVVELSSDSGMSWTDLGPYFIKGGYPSRINMSDNPIAGRFAFTGYTDGFQTSMIDLSPWSGKSIKIKFRLATDESYAARGWNIDDITITDSSRVKIAAALVDQHQIPIIGNVVAVNVLPALVCTCMPYMNMGNNNLSLKKTAPEINTKSNTNQLANKKEAP